MSIASLPRPGRYMPWIFVAGFAVVIAVNTAMVWVAVGSFSGLYADKARDRGVHYNDIVAERRARDALGWRVETDWLPAANRLELRVTDSEGRPLANAYVAVEFVRPVEKR